MKKIKENIFLCPGVQPLSDIKEGVIKANFANNQHMFDFSGFKFPNLQQQKDVYIVVNEESKTHEEMRNYLTANELKFCDFAANYLLGLPFEELLPLIYQVNSRELTATGEQSVMERSDGQKFLMYVETLGKKFNICLKNVSFKEGKFGKLRYRNQEMILAEKI